MATGGVKLTVVVKRNLFAEMSGNLSQARARRVADAGEKLLATAVRIVPFATGELRDSHDLSATEGEAVVIATAPYAGFVHEGTYKMEARPWLAEAAQIVGPEYVRGWQTDLESDLAG